VSSQLLVVWLEVLPPTVLDSFREAIYHERYIAKPMRLSKKCGGAGGISSRTSIPDGYRLILYGIVPD
jgi:hypothetical protein